MRRKEGKEEKEGPFYAIALFHENRFAQDEVDGFSRNGGEFGVGFFEVGHLPQVIGRSDHE